MVTETVNRSSGVNAALQLFDPVEDELIQEAPLPSLRFGFRNRSTETNPFAARWQYSWHLSVRKGQGFSGQQRQITGSLTVGALYQVNW